MKDKDRPWVSNYPPLKKWLDDHKARHMWQVRTDGKAMDDEEPARGYVEQWILPNGRLVIVTVWADRGGWNLFTDSGTVNIATTLNDASRRVAQMTK